MARWESLREDFRESNRLQADHALEKLRKINCDVVRVADRPVIEIAFRPEEIEIMAEMEHARWNVERLLKGWKYGTEKDANRCISPYLVTWDKLPEEVKDWDRQAVKHIPRYLAQVGLEVQRRD